VVGLSRDGRFRRLRPTDTNTSWDLWALPHTGNGKPFPVVQSPFQEMTGEISPNARWVAYQSNESGQHEVYVQPFSGGGPRVQVSTNGGSQPRWRRDGRELFYIALDGRLMATSLSDCANGNIEED